MRRGNNLPMKHRQYMAEPVSEPKFKFKVLTQNAVSQGLWPWTLCCFFLIKALVAGDNTHGLFKGRVFLPFLWQLNKIVWELDSWIHNKSAFFFFVCLPACFNWTVKSSAFSMDFITDDYLVFVNMFIMTCSWAPVSSHPVSSAPGRGTGEISHRFQFEKGFNFPETICINSRDVTDLVPDQQDIQWPPLKLQTNLLSGCILQLSPPHHPVPSLLRWLSALIEGQR